ncbi:hypothetical protein DYB32_002810 [Aphanomyces invadans]|uniref:Uncharacterized protein n=1 Tax=Aphanomyces invadans TaxID=157072 RepID=A0A3R6Z246_9STRA|nr:hypothetical protein DYB32_002810 [Aphanomyces invadans]
MDSPADSTPAPPAAVASPTANPAEKPVAKPTPVATPVPVAVPVAAAVASSERTNLLPGSASESAMNKFKQMEIERINGYLRLINLLMGFLLGWLGLYHFYHLDSYKGFMSSLFITVQALLIILFELRENFPNASKIVQDYLGFMYTAYGRGALFLVYVDVTENAALGKRFDIKGFPTILFFHKGSMYAYEAARTKEALVKFAQSGYASIAKVTVPGVPSAVDAVKKELDAVRLDIVQLLVTKKNAILAIFASGLTIGLLLGCFCNCFSGRPADSKQKRH